MNKILSKEISFELAKLLKEKGVKIDTEKILFYKDEINNIEEHQIKNRNLLYKADAQFISDDNEYQVYTIGEVIDWLYEKYKFWINVEMDYAYSSERIYFYGKVKWFEDNLVNISTTRSFNSQTEAYVDVIKYCLEQLIKNAKNENT